MSERGRHPVPLACAPPFAGHGYSVAASGKGA